MCVCVFVYLYVCVSMSVCVCGGTIEVATGSIFQHVCVNASHQSETFKVGVARDMSHQDLATIVADGLANANVASLRGFRERGGHVTGRNILDMVFRETFEDTKDALRELCLMVPPEDPLVLLVSDLRLRECARVLQTERRSLRDCQERSRVCAIALVKATDAEVAAKELKAVAVKAALEADMSVNRFHGRIEDALIM